MGAAMIELCSPQIWCSLVHPIGEQILQVRALETKCQIIDNSAAVCSIALKFGSLQSFSHDIRCTTNVHHQEVKGQDHSVKKRKRNFA